MRKLSNLGLPAVRYLRVTNLGIRTRLVLYFSFLFAVVITLLQLTELYGVPGTGLKGNIEQARLEEFKELNVVADSKKEHLVSWLEERRGDIRVLVESDPVKRYLSDIETVLNENVARGKSGEELWAIMRKDKQSKALTQHLNLVLRTYGVYDDIHVIGPTGTIIASADYADLGKGHHDLKSITESAYSSAGPSFLVGRDPESLDTELLVISTIDGSIFDENKPPLVLMMHVNTDDMITSVLHTGGGLGETGEVLLVDKDVRILSSLKYPLEDGRLAQPLEYQISAKPALYASQGSEGLIATEDYRGQKVLAAFRYISVGPETGWGMVVKVDEAEVFEDLREGILRASILGLAGIAVVVGLTYLVATNISHPIRLLRATIQKVEDGDLSARTSVTGPNEIRSLATTFNSMIQRVRMWNQELEQEVETRTQELVVANEALQVSEEEARRLADENAAIAEIGRIISSSHDIDEIYARFATTVRKLIPFDRIVINVIDLERGTATVTYKEGLEVPGRPAGRTFPLSGSVTESVTRAGLALREDLTALEDMVGWRSSYKAFFRAGVRSVLAVPLKSSTNPVGSLHLASIQPQAYSGRHMALAERVGRQIVGAIANAHLYSERKRAEEALQDSNRRLEEALAELEATQRQVIQQERLHALGQMASGIAHDFNNALVPILGLTDILLERPETQNDKEKVAGYLEMIRTAAQDAANVVRRMRAFYRNRDDDEDFMSVSINDLVREVISLTEVKWKTDSQARSIGINIETDLHEIPHVMGSEADLREVLTNLILNAIDAMPNGGTMTFRTRHNDRHVVLEVSDTGTGMTEDVRQHCLEPFFTSKGGRGTGMGLAMVYGIIQRHRGTIDIESEVGKGSNFIIRLPAQAKRKTERGRVKAAATQSRPLRILVVDDELPVLQVVTEYLRGDGHTVETATNGHEALEKFSAGGFDLVVTDRAMPDMSGDQLAAAIKTIAPRPVILLTGFGDIMHAAGERPSGVHSIITKPVTLTDLRQAVAKVMVHWV